MKVFLPAIVIVLLYNSCCKCDVPRNWEGFRFLDSADHDLVYGPDKKYNKDSIRFFYVKGKDTLLHPSRGFGLRSDVPDTVTAVSFDQNGKDTAFVDFGNGDIDTLILKYTQTGGGCCDERFEIIPQSYNKKAIVKNEWIVVVK